MSISYTFLEALILANSLIIKSVTRSFIMLNTMMKNEDEVIFLGSWLQIMVLCDKNNS